MHVSMCIAIIIVVVWGQRKGCYGEQIYYSTFE